MNEIDSTIWDAYGALSPKKAIKNSKNLIADSSISKNKEPQLKNNIITNLPETIYKVDQLKSQSTPIDKDKKTSFLLEVDASEFSKDSTMAVGSTIKTASNWQIVLRVFSNWGRIFSIYFQLYFRSSFGRPD